jgi:hypothetical protein
VLSNMPASNDASRVRLGAQHVPLLDHLTMGALGEPVEVNSQSMLGSCSLLQMRIGPFEVSLRRELTECSPLAV